MLDVNQVDDFACCKDRQQGSKTRYPNRQSETEGGDNRTVQDEDQHPDEISRLRVMMAAMISKPPEEEPSRKAVRFQNRHDPAKNRAKCQILNQRINGNKLHEEGCSDN